MSELELAKKSGPAEPVVLRDDLVIRINQRRCPYCHADVAVGRDAVACEQCLALHHGDCWREGRRCASCGATRGLGRSRMGWTSKLLLGLAVAGGLAWFATGALRGLRELRQFGFNPDSGSVSPKEEEEQTRRLIEAARSGAAELAQNAKPAPPPLAAPVGTVFWDEHYDWYRTNENGTKDLARSRFDKPSALHRLFSGEITIAELAAAVDPFGPNRIEAVASRVPLEQALKPEQIAAIEKDLTDLRSRPVFFLIGGHFGAELVTPVSTDPKALIVLAPNFATHGNLYAEGPIVFAEATSTNWTRHVVSKSDVFIWGEPRVDVIAAPVGKIHVFAGKPKK
jgi:hypothetical protein